MLAVWTPPDDPRFSVCLFERVTHRPCATCGMTRALAALAKGHVADAARLHPMALVLVVEACVIWLALVLARMRAMRLPRRLPDVLLAGNAVLLIVVWIVRMAMGAI